MTDLCSIYERLIEAGMPKVGGLKYEGWRGGDHSWQLESPNGTTNSLKEQHARAIIQDWAMTWFVDCLDGFVARSIGGKGWVAFRLNEPASTRATAIEAIHADVCGEEGR